MLKKTLRRTNQRVQPRVMQAVKRRLRELNYLTVYYSIKITLSMSSEVLFLFVLLFRMHELTFFPSCFY